MSELALVTVRSSDLAVWQVLMRVGDSVRLDLLMTTEGLRLCMGVMAVPLVIDNDHPVTIDALSKA